jgi:hypothetical protein
MALMLTGMHMYKYIIIINALEIMQYYILVPYCVLNFLCYSVTTIGSMNMPYLRCQMPDDGLMSGNML